MPHRSRIIHPSSISEIDRILLSPDIGGCRWPLSSWLEKHRDALDHPGTDPEPPRRPPQRHSRLLLILRAEISKH